MILILIIHWKKYNKLILEISHITSDLKGGIGITGLGPLNNFEYGIWKSIHIDRECFSQEIYRALYQFVNEVLNINPLYLETEWLKRIIGKMNRTHSQV